MALRVLVRFLLNSCPRTRGASSADAVRGTKGGRTHCRKTTSGGRGRVPVFRITTHRPGVAALPTGRTPWRRSRRQDPSHGRACESGFVAEAAVPYRASGSVSESILLDPPPASFRSAALRRGVQGTRRSMDEPESAGGSDGVCQGPAALGRVQPDRPPIGSGYGRRARTRSRFRPRHPTPRGAGLAGTLLPPPKGGVRQDRWREAPAELGCTAKGAVFYRKERKELKTRRNNEGTKGSFPVNPRRGAETQRS